MNPLEEGWLSIELEAIDAELEDWSQGLKESFDSLALCSTEPSDADRELG